MKLEPQDIIDSSSYLHLLFTNICIVYDHDQVHSRHEDNFESNYKTNK